MQILEKPIRKVPTSEAKPPPKSYLKVVFWALLGLLLAILVGVIVYDDQGKVDIPPNRKQQLDTALRKFDNAEQYALCLKM